MKKILFAIKLMFLSLMVFGQGQSPYFWNTHTKYLYVWNFSTGTWQTITGKTGVNATYLQGDSIATTAPTSGQFLQWNSSTGAWTPGTGSLNSYYAGTGLSLSGYTFSATAYTAGTGLSLTGYTFANTYVAGTGLTLTGNTFTHNAHSGDVSGTTSLTVTKLQGYAIAAIAPTTNYYLKWAGEAWTPSVVTLNTYYAGNGLSLTGNTFSTYNGLTSGTLLDAYGMTLQVVNGIIINTSTP